MSKLTLSSLYYVLVETGTYDKCNHFKLLKHLNGFPAKSVVKITYEYNQILHITVTLSESRSKLWWAPPEEM